MVDIKEFLAKVRSDIKGAKNTYIVYDSHDFISIRQTSNKTLSIRPDNLVGVYSASSTDTDIIDDCLHYFEEYERKQAEQSERLNKAMGVAQ